MRYGVWFVALIVAALSLGCEFDDTSSVDTSAATSSPSVEESASDDSSPDSTTMGDISDSQAEWDAISWKTASGPSARGARQVMTLDAEITSDGRFIRFGWDRFPWRGDGLGHFFVWDGARWVGGKFEWIRSGGQAVKETKNIRNGYNGLGAPAPGTPVAFAWTNPNGTERSNLVKTTWR